VNYHSGFNKIINCWAMLWTHFTFLFVSLLPFNSNPAFLNSNLVQAQEMIKFDKCYLQLNAIVITIGILFNTWKIGKQIKWIEAGKGDAEKQESSKRQITLKQMLFAAGVVIERIQKKK
jgi:hypothetical protein